MRISAKYKNTITYFIILAAFILLTAFSSEAKEGVKEGLGICFNIIIPSLFPMMIISSLLNLTPIPESIRKISKKPMQKIFGFSPQALPLFITGLTGGYPLSGRLAEKAYLSGQISKTQGAKACLFLTSPGIPFAVTVCGSAMFSSAAIGVSLYFSCLFSDLLMCFLYSRIKPDEKNDILYGNGKKAEKRADFIEAVENSARSVYSVCIWITAFGVISKIADNFISSPKIKELLNIVLEVTTGVNYSSDIFSPVLAAFVLGFGGLSLTCQLIPVMKTLGINPLKYIAARAGCGVCSALTEKILLSVFPISLNVDNLQIKLFSNSAAGSAALMFMSIVFIMTVREKKYLRPADK